MPSAFTGRKAIQAGIRIEGGNQAISKFTKRIERAMRGYIADTEDGLEEAIDEIAKTALEMTPRDTGALQASQRKRVFMNETGSKLIGEITYNEDGSVPYAGFVHEIPADHSQVNYPNNPPNAQYKFLEKAFQIWEPKIVKIIEKHTERRGK